MKKKLKSINIIDKLLFEELKNKYQNSYDPYISEYFIPRKDFMAMLKNTDAFSLNPYASELDQIYLRKENDIELLKIDNTRLLKLLHINNETLVFRVSVNNIAFLSDNNDYISGYDNAKKNIERPSKGEKLGTYFVITLSKYEYEEYLIQIKNDFSIEFLYNNMLFNKITSSFIETLTFNLFNEENDSSNFLDTKESKDNDNYKILGLYYQCIIKPIINLQKDFLEDILNTHIYAIEDILTDLENIKDISSIPEYLLAINKIGKIINEMIKFSETIPYSKVEQKEIITAEKLLEIKINEENQKNIKEKEIKEEINTKIQNYEDNIKEDFFEKLEIREELLKMYMNTN